MDIYDPCCGSAGLLIKCQLVLAGKDEPALPQERSPTQALRSGIHPATWAMANMNMIIHDMEGKIEIGDTFRNPKFRKANRLQTFDRVVANPCGIRMVEGKGLRRRRTGPVSERSGLPR